MIKYSISLIIICLNFSILAADIDIIPEKLERIDAIVNQAIKENKTPGAVVLVGCNNEIVYKKAFGKKTGLTDAEPMEENTIFDLASITKVFTAISILILAENGLLRLGEYAGTYLPAFAQEGKDKITIEYLLLHISGLPSANPLSDFDNGYDAALEKIYKIKLSEKPGTKFIYSDIGYIILGEIIKKVSGKPLNDFINENILIPANMINSCFLPSQDLKKLMAPTQEKSGDLAVHDPRAYLMGGVSGHAGLFSNADDLSLLCKMLLNYGSIKGNSILSHLGIMNMFKIYSLPDSKQRTLAWDVSTEYSSFLGDFFPAGVLGHTGFTGTSILLDPALNVFIIILTNRVYLKEGDIRDLRSSIANIVASSIIFN